MNDKKNFHENFRNQTHPQRGKSRLQIIDISIRCVGMGVGVGVMHTRLRPDAGSCQCASGSTTGGLKDFPPLIRKRRTNRSVIPGRGLKLIGIVDHT